MLEHMAVEHPVAWIVGHQRDLGAAVGVDSS
jgi:hypothetical protein